MEKKKMYLVFVVVLVVAMLVAALAGAGIAIHFNNKEDTSSLSQENQPAENNNDVTPGNVVTPTNPVENPSAPVVDPSVPVVDPSAAEEATQATAGIKVGPYTTGTFYFYNAEGKNLKLRASASVDVDTGVEIPSGTKLEVKQIIASDVAAYPYWGAVSYKGTDGYVAMQFLMTEADYIAEFGEEAVATPGNYTVGTYVVSGTGEYGLKVKPEPGYGDALSMAYDGDEVEVLAIVTWEDADNEELRYWGNIEWDGHDAYVCMAYLEKAE
ncbi:MAG: hypothetical protein E7523_03135 [Ruminococcaceae bacterium]|nr:hypothetical protein [Oscillospiraceae bacterium]